MKKMSLSEVIFLLLLKHKKVSCHSDKDKIRIRNTEVFFIEIYNMHARKHIDFSI